MMTRAGAIALLLLPALTVLLVLAADPARAEFPWDGGRIMAQVLDRHRDYPRVYEEQTMILFDGEGRKSARKLRRFHALDPDLTLRLILVIDQPQEVRGVVFKVIQPQGRKGHRQIWLPALGRAVEAAAQGTGAQGIMGTDLLVEDLLEGTGDLEYVRKKDLVMNRIPYYVVEGFSRELGNRVHFIRKDNFLMTRTDFYTPGRRLCKRLTRHDLRQADQAFWHAGMVRMENFQTGHTTLIKTDRLVLSRDYVPDRLFDLDWPGLSRYLFDPDRFDQDRFDQDRFSPKALGGQDPEPTKGKSP